MNVIATSTLFGGGKIVVPSEIRLLLNVEDGSKIVWLQDGERLYVMASKPAAKEMEFYKPRYLKYPTKKELEKKTKRKN